MLSEDDYVADSFMVPWAIVDAMTSPDVDSAVTAHSVVVSANIESRYSDPPPLKAGAVDHLGYQIPVQNNPLYNSEPASQEDRGGRQQLAVSSTSQGNPAFRQSQHRVAKQASYDLIDSMVDDPSYDCIDPSVLFDGAGPRPGSTAGRGINSFLFYFVWGSEDF